MLTSKPRSFLGPNYKGEAGLFPFSRVVMGERQQVGEDTHKPPAEHISVLGSDGETCRGVSSLKEALV